MQHSQYTNVSHKRVLGLFDSSGLIKCVHWAWLQVSATDANSLDEVNNFVARWTLEADPR